MIPLRLRRFQRSAERMREQHELDLRYAFGSIALEEWRTETDRLSEPVCGQPGSASPATTANR